MGRRKKEKEGEEEEQSKSALRFENLKAVTASLSACEKKCVILTVQPITDAIENVLKRVRFKNLDVEELKEALLYEEVVFAAPKVVGICSGIREKMEGIIASFNIPNDFRRQQVEA